ncbi:MAG: type II secretion system F family protein [Oscillospiraceae bacterium]|jgi:type IV pilus assembly protein PilC|nr:type II secretion system F family protein [Oscillospiraceae bacterium]
MNYKYLSSFCMSLHLAFKSGVPLEECLELFAIDDSRSRDLSERVGAGLRASKPFADSLRAVNAFPKYMCDMVEVGEKTGRLDDTLLALSKHYERQDIVAADIRSAAAYPLMLFVALIAVFVIFAVKLLPIFGDVYSQLGAVMPPSASAVMWFGRRLAEYRIPVTCAILAIAVAAVLLRRRLAALARHLAQRSSLGRQLTAARLSDLLSTTLSSGMTVIESLRMSSKVVDDRAVQAGVDASTTRAESGESLTECVRSLKLFPEMYVRMIGVGERTGSAVEALEEITRRTSASANDRLENVVGTIEPALVIVMSVLVGALLISVMLPLAGVMSLL